MCDMEEDEVPEALSISKRAAYGWGCKFQSNQK